MHQSLLPVAKEHRTHPLPSSSSPAATEGQLRQFEGHAFSRRYPFPGQSEIPAVNQHSSARVCHIFASAFKLLGYVPRWSLGGQIRQTAVCG